MLKAGDKAIVNTDEGGSFYKGKRVVVVRVLSDNFTHPIRVRAEDGNCECWYAEYELKKVDE